MNFPLGYWASEIASNWDRPSWWRGRIQDRVNGPLQRCISANDHVEILDEDWDLLVVIDACRADVFDEGFDSTEFDSYSTVRSPASTTPEWLRKNFTGTYGDIVYVAANPMVSLHKPNSFHALIESWREHIDPETGVIPAENVTEDAKDALRQYPNKRIIVHYMQPHFPFVENSELQYAQWNTFTDEFDEFESSTGGKDADVSDIWGALEKGLVDKDQVWEGYRENVSYVMRSVTDLLSSTDRRSVVTSDHGNLVGERCWPVPIRGYGHPGGLRQKALTSVPFGTVEANETRPEIISERVGSGTDAESEDITERLKSLGYA